MEGFWSLLRSWLRPHQGIPQDKLPLYLGFFEFVHNVRKRGKALLPSLLQSLVWWLPGIHKEPVQNLNQLTSAKTVIATIDRLIDAKTGDGLLELLGYGREIIIRVVVAWI
ncbi:MAG: hypothetical protein KME57_29840 [Scytonema hyalinum WJT4-NPBG1]|jgi:hypothetical protein|nr:hypothetical protein [Scytonema hyalinum WJT4-NPBG1]